MRLMLKTKTVFILLVVATFFGVSIFPASSLVHAQGEAAYNFVDENTIEGQAGGTYILDESASPAGYYSTTASGCPTPAYITADFDTLNLSTDTVNGELWQPFRIGDEPPDCNNFVASSILIGNFSASGIDESEVDNVVGERPTCASTVGGGLAWLVCPVSTLLINVLDALASWLSNLLQVTPLTSDSPAFSVWESMRNIALVVFALALVIVIFGQGLGIDAYTVKRIAPRLGVAAIGIMLSFYVAAFMIDIFNVLGQGMYSLMLSTLGQEGITVTAEGTFAEWSAFAAALSAGAFAAFSGGLFYLFSIILIPIVMAFLAGFAVVLIRQVLIILLVVVSPIAIAAIVLPNTNEWFKRWWGLFSSLLMMYPLIMILLASGSIFAVIVTGDGGGGTITESNFFNQLIALAALGFTVGLIPFTLRASSSLLGRVASVVNNPNRGPIDRWRQAAHGKADVKRGIRRQNKISEYGALKRDEEKGGTKKPFRKAWLRAGTGLYGVGGGEYGKTHRAEEIAQARTGQQRQTIAQEKAKRETAQFGDFDMQKRISEWESQGKDRKEIAENLSEIAKEDFGSIDSEAAARAIITQRLEPQLNKVFDHIATNGTNSQKQALAQFKQENFGNIDSFAAHLSRGAFTTNPDTGEVTGFKPAYGQLPGLNPEQLSTQKGIEGALIHAGRLAEQGNIEQAQKITNGLVSTYSDTAPHQRTADNNRLFANAAEGFVDVGGGKYVEVPKPDSKVVDKFTASIGTGTENIPEGSKKVSAESVMQRNKPAQTTVRASGLGSDAAPPSPASRVENYGSTAAPQAATNEQVQIQKVYEAAERVGQPLVRGTVTPENLDTYKEMFPIEDVQTVMPATSNVVWRSGGGVGDLPVQTTGKIEQREGKQFVEVAPPEGNKTFVPVEQIYESSDSTTPMTVEQIRTAVSPPKTLTRKAPSGETTSVTPIGQPFEEGGKRVVQAKHGENIIDVPVDELYESPEATTNVSDKMITRIVSAPTGPSSVPGATTTPATSREEGVSRLSSRQKPNVPGSEELRNRPPSSNNPQSQEPQSEPPQSNPPVSTPPESTTSQEPGAPSAPSVRQRGRITDTDLGKDVPETKPDENTQEANTESGEPPQSNPFPNPLLRSGDREITGDLSEDAPPPEESDTKPGDIIGPDEDNEENN